MEKRYVIKDLFSCPHGIMYMNNSTTGLEDIWETTWPKDKKPDNDYQPKIFVDLKEAKRYLKEIKRLYNSNWKEIGWSLKARGYCKPQWDIYEY